MKRRIKKEVRGPEGEKNRNKQPVKEGKTDDEGRVEGQKKTKTKRFREWSSEKINGVKKFWRKSGKMIIIPLLVIIWAIIYVRVPYQQVYIFLSLGFGVVLHKVLERISSRKAFVETNFDEDRVRGIVIDSEHAEKDFEMVDASGKPAQISYTAKSKKGQAIFVDMIDLKNGIIEINEMCENIDFARNVRPVLRDLKNDAVYYMNEFIWLQENLETLSIKKAHRLQENRDIKGIADTIDDHELIRKQSEQMRENTGTSEEHQKEIQKTLENVVRAQHQIDDNEGVDIDV